MTAHGRGGEVITGEVILRGEPAHHAPLALRDRRGESPVGSRGRVPRGPPLSLGPASPSARRSSAPASTGGGGRRGPALPRSACLVGVAGAVVPARLQDRSSRSSRSSTPPTTTSRWRRRGPPARPAHRGRGRRSGQLGAIARRGRGGGNGALVAVPTGRQPTRGGPNTQSGEPGHGAQPADRDRSDAHPPAVVARPGHPDRRGPGPSRHGLPGGRPAGPVAIVVGSGRPASARWLAEDVEGFACRCSGGRTRSTTATAIL